MTYFLYSFVAALLLFPVATWCATRFNALSHVDARRRQEKRIPLLGGAALFTVGIVGQFAFGISFNAAFWLSAFIVVAVGVYDDFKELKAPPKLLAQIFAAGLWVFAQPHGGLLFEQAGMNPIAAKILAVIWIIGFINSMNLIDGMDGIAGGISVISLTVMAIWNPQSALTPAILLFAGASAGFLARNLPPAKIYLGDSGSNLLGFVIAAQTMALQTTGAGSDVAGLRWLAPFMLLAHPQMDTCLSLLRRYRAKRPLFLGDHGHIHHKLQKIGFSVRQSLGVVYGVSLYTTAAAFVLWMAPTMYAAGMLFFAVFGLMGVLSMIYVWDRRMAERLSGVGHTILSKQLDHAQNESAEERYPAVVLDLESYYREFNSLPPPRVQAFAHDFTKLLREEFPHAPIKATSRSSVVVYSSESHAIRQPRFERFKVSFESLLRDYQILESEYEPTHGVTFYTSAEAALKDFDQEAFDRSI